MRLVRWVLGVLVAVAAVALAIYVGGNAELIDRLTALFWSIQLRLLLTSDFEQFLVVFNTVSLAALVLVIGGCATLLVVMGGKLSAARQRSVDRIAAAKQEVHQTHELHLRQYEQLAALGQTLTKQLDKRLVIQSIIETASRMTSSTQANSVVSLWLFDQETDTFRFEKGLYCDETLFEKTELQVNDQPFGRMILTKKPWVLPTWETGVPFVRREKGSQLGGATGLMVIPCVIEERVLAVLLVWCHPEIVKRYEERQSFYNAVWAELTLAATIAIQGAVTIMDRLTNVHTREYFMTRLLQEIERSNRYRLPLSLLMIDIDNFKLVNDMLGHPQGDTVLRLVAKFIKGEVRAIDLVGRYGGEEFVVMLPETGYGEETTSVAGALAVAERIRKAVDDEFRGLQKPLNLTVSVGVAVRRFPEDRELGYQEMVRLSDEQLYRAKTTGKNRVCAALPQQSEPVT